MWDMMVRLIRILCMLVKIEYLLRALIISSAVVCCCVVAGEGERHGRGPGCSVAFRHWPG